MKKIKKITEILLLCIVLNLCLFSCTISSINSNIKENIAESNLLYALTSPDGNLEGVKESIEDGANINEFENAYYKEDGINSVLALAVKNRHYREAKLLIEHGADGDYVTTDGTPIYNFCIYNSNIEFLEYFLSKFSENINEVRRGYTALDELFFMHDDEIILNKMEILLRYGAKVRSKTIEIALKEDLSCYSSIKKALTILIDSGEKSDLDPMLEAAILGDSNKLNELTKRNEIDENNKTQIIFNVVAFGSLDTLKHLQNKGFSLKQSDNNYNTLLSIAAKFGNLDILKYLLSEGLDIEGDTGDGIITKKPLLAAIENNQYETAKYLLEQGANVNMGTDNYASLDDPFTCAVKSGNTKMIDLLKEYGYPFNNKRIYNNLLEAIIFHNTNILKYFFENGMDPNIEGEQGSLLAESCNLGDLEAVRLLIDYGADINGRKEIRKPIMIASGRGETEIVRYLIKKGALINNDLNNVDEPESALMSAVLSGSYDIVKLLVENSADIEFENWSSHETVVEMAPFKSRNILKYLVECGADINHQNIENRNTALMNSVINNDIKCVEILLNADADKNLKNKEGKTALDISKEKKYEPIIDLLKNRKKSVDIFQSKCK